LERKFTEYLTGFLAYRLEYDQLTEVSDATAAVLEEFESNGMLSGLSTGLTWNTADDPFNPTRGWTLSFVGEQVGSFLGGRFDFYKLVGEAKGYYPLAEKTVLAARLKIGFAEPFNGSREVPLFERFYAGGSAGVRGYERHRLGPLSASDDPVGGRSLAEGSLELRQQFLEKLGGALFLDFGQVSLRSFDVPFDDLRFATGFGIRYATPVGPLRLDIGFPFRPPSGDRSWQIHFSIGQSF
jgi:outer membrane protein assembly factor BamA